MIAAIFCQLILSFEDYTKSNISHELCPQALHCAVISILYISKVIYTKHTKCSKQLNESCNFLFLCRSGRFGQYILKFLHLRMLKYPTFEFIFSCFTFFFCIINAHKLDNIQLRKLSILASRYDVLGQNILEHTQSIVYARLKASFLDNLGCRTLVIKSREFISTQKYDHMIRIYSHHHEQQ